MQGKPIRQDSYSVVRINVKDVYVFSIVTKAGLILISSHDPAVKFQAAHSSIAASLEIGQRIIFVSPNKSHGIQKYREMRENFVNPGDVGFMAEGNYIDDTAKCLVMTIRKFYA